MFIQRVKHYHQWLRTAILSKPNLVRFPLILSEYKARQKDQALVTCIQSLLSKNGIERVENVKSLWFYSRLFLVPKPHQRWRPVMDLSRLNTFPHIEKFKMETSRVYQDPLIPGEWVLSIDLSDAYIHFPIHPNSRKYLRFRYTSQVFQFTSLPFGLATAPPGLYNDCKGSETNGPLQRTQNSPIPGRLADQVPVSGGSPSEHSGGGRPNSVLGLDNKSGKIRTETYSGVFVREPRIPSRFSPCKTHSREMAQTSGFDPKTQVKTCLDCKMFDVANWVACLNGETVPEGRLHTRPFQFHLKEHWRYPQSLDSLLPWTEAIAAHLDWWQNPSNVLRGADRHPKDHSIQLFKDGSNKGWGAHLDQSFTKGLWSDREKRLHINVLELKAVSLALGSFKDQCQNQTVLVATDNSTVVAYINKQGGTHSAEMCALLLKIMTWCHHYHITLKARHIPGCLNVMADLLSRSNQVQSTEWSLHPQVFKQICQKWFTPHVDLFATHLNHKLSLYVSPVPDPKAWDIDSLNINWMVLTACAYPPTALLHRVIQKIRQCPCQILGPSATLNRDPTAT